MNGTAVCVETVVWLSIYNGQMQWADLGCVVAASALTAQLLVGAIGILRIISRSADATRRRSRIGQLCSYRCRSCGIWCSLTRTRDASASV